MNNILQKFLVSSDIQRWLEKHTYTVEKTEQFYKKIDKDSQCYYLRCFPDQYFKVMTNSKGDEDRSPVSEEVYATERKKHIGRKVVKKIYTVNIDEEDFVLFEYLKSLKGIYIFEAYCKDAQSLQKSQIIETLQPFVLKEINNDKKYSDMSLAMYVKPMEYNLDKLFEQIDAFEAANLFFWQVPRRIYVRDGVVLVLYKNLRLLHHYKVNFQRKHMSATLHRLRVLMRRTATILETFEDLFNPNVSRFCRTLLLRYHEETKFLRYLYFLEELCATRDTAKLSLYSELKTLISEEEKLVTQMLLSKPFTQLIQILTRELYEQENEQYFGLKKWVKKVVRVRLKKFEVQLSKTSEGYNDEMLEELYISMDTLQTLLEDFFHIIGEKETQMVVDELNILLKPLREYRNCKEREMIMKGIKEQSDYTILDIEPLLCEHVKELEEKILNALKLLRTSKFYI